MRQYLEAMRSGDREAAFGHYAEDIVGHVPGRSSRAGELRGKDAVVGYIRAVVAHASEGVEVELIDMLASEERVALIVRERLRRDGRTLDMRRVNVYRVEGEKIVEIRIFEADQYAVDEFLEG
jgi:ketosteroid isomerase-like protein